MKRVVHARSWPAPRFRYSPLVAAGPFVKTAGMIALDAATGKLQEGGPAAEAAKILATLGAVMTELRLDRSMLVSATIYTTDFDRFPDINAAWDRFFTDDETPPARTSLGVTALPLGATVEMEFLFYAPELDAAVGGAAA